jgi:hypothetical protein
MFDSKAKSIAADMDAVLRKDGNATWTETDNQVLAEYYWLSEGERAQVDRFRKVFP